MTGQEMVVCLNWPEDPRYIIYSDGRVYSSIGRKFLKPNLDSDGYLKLDLGKGRTRTIHRLVATTFIPNPENLPQVNHEDGDKFNNYASNLVWCDSAYNNKHAYYIGLNYYREPPHFYGKDHPMAKGVIQLTINTLEVLNTFDTITEAALSVGKPNGHSNIASCCHGRRGKAYGYRWRFAS